MKSENEKQKKLLAELAALEEATQRKNTLIKKYGENTATILYDFKDEDIDRFDSLSKKYGKSSAVLILQGKVRIGWNKDMCTESWGKPYDINVTIGSFGRHEQWVYKDGSYLYFLNGKLESIQY